MSPVMVGRRKMCACGTSSRLFMRTAVDCFCEHTLHCGKSFCLGGPKILHHCKHTSGRCLSAGERAGCRASRDGGGAHQILGFFDIRSMRVLVRRHVVADGLSGLLRSARVTSCVAWWLPS
jgi:hypothetical protein